MASPRWFNVYAERTDLSVWESMAKSRSQLASMLFLDLNLPFGKALAAEKTIESPRRMRKLKKREPNCIAAPIIERRSFLAASGLGALTVGLSTPIFGQTATNRVEPILQPVNPGNETFMDRAFEMRQSAIEYGDQAYGAVIVRNNVIIGQSWSKVILDRDPTAHVEMAAIRDAARRISSRELAGAFMYSSSRPCPMCEAAAFWAGMGQMVYGRELRRAGSPELCE